MIRRLALLLASIVVALTTACAARTPASDAPTGPSGAAGPSSAAGPVTPTGPVSPTGPASPNGPTAGSPSSGSGCTAHAVVSDSANGSTVCVVRGGDLTLQLHVAAGDGWSPPEATGEVLGPAMPLPTPYGFVGWSFRALTAGTADILTSRLVCPSAVPGAMRCHGMLGYRVHVVVK